MIQVILAKRCLSQTSLSSSMHNAAFSGPCELCSSCRPSYLRKIAGFSRLPAKCEQASDRSWRIRSYTALKYKSTISPDWVFTLLLFPPNHYISPLWRVCRRPLVYPIRSVQPLSAPDNHNAGCGNSVASRGESPPPRNYILRYCPPCFDTRKPNTPIPWNQIRIVPCPLSTISRFYPIPTYRRLLPTRVCILRRRLLFSLLYAFYALFRPICPQPKSTHTVEEVLFGIAAEDIPKQFLRHDEFECLNLNITCPGDLTLQSRVPVMLWFHGYVG